MNVDEQIQSYRISLEVIKPNLYNLSLLGTMKMIINFLCQLRLDPELTEHVHMNMGHHRRTANHNTERAREIQKSLLKVQRFQHISTEVLSHERTTNKGHYQCSHK